MVMQSVGEEPPLVPFFPELLFGLSFLLVLATVALWLVMVVRNRGRRTRAGERHDADA